MRLRIRLALGTWSGRVGASGAVLLVLCAVVAPIVLDDAASERDVANMHQGPSLRHWAGTDGLGRDVFARVLVASRPALGYALAVVALGAIVGVTLGMAPTVLGRRSGRAITAAINAMVAIPGLLLALFVAVVFGVGAGGATIALSIAAAPSLARLTSTLSASVAESDYLSAARVLGVPRRKLLFRHVLPNIAEPLLLSVTTSIGAALLAFAALSFLGLGIQAPYYDWGRMLNEGLSRIYLAPAASLAPAIAICVAGVTFNLLGDALARAAGGTVQSASTQPPPASAAAVAVRSADDHRLLDVQRLSVRFPSPSGDVIAVRDVSLDVGRGEIVAIVGESGSGKSATALAIAQLIAHPGTATFERLHFDGHDVVTMAAGERRRLLGTTLPMVFQNPGTSLNPALRIGRQLTEVVEVHRGIDRRAAHRRAVEKLELVRIPNPRRRLRAYAHELSGGMKQRVVIAMGLMGTPKLYIADEPTTALDVTVQRTILDLLRTINREQRASVLFISHDLGAVSELCDRVLVMYAGRIVESAPIGAVLGGAAHPYTRALLAAVPTMSVDRDAPLPTISGRPPDPREVGDGCAFAPRCPLADERCEHERPELAVVDGASWQAACWHPRSPA